MGSNTSNSNDAQLALDSLRRIVRVLREAARLAERRFGLSGAQLFVLHKLAGASPMSLNELARRTHTHQSSVSTVVTRLVEQRLADMPAPGAPPSEPDAPAKAFLDWLKAIVSADRSGISDTAAAMLKASNFAPSESPPGKAASGFREAKPTNVDWRDPVQWIQHQFKLESLDLDFLQQLIGVYTEPDNFAAQLQLLREKVGTAVADPVLGPLSLVTLYEILRQCAPAMMNPGDSEGPSPGIVRGENAGDPKAPVKDGTPINIAFSYSGLTALKMNGTTLTSFPDAFKQGMAARAERLHDTGPSAPEFWEGELGLRSVHGYFTGGFVLNEGKSANESFWKAMRRDVEAGKVRGCFITRRKPLLLHH